MTRSTSAGSSPTIHLTAAHLIPFHTVHEPHPHYVASDDHFKSKGSDCDDFGNYNLTASTESVKCPTPDPDGAETDNYLILDEIEPHAKEDSINAFEAGAHVGN